MTWIIPSFTPDYRRPLDNNPNLRWSDLIITKAAYGPTIRELVADPDFRKYLVQGIVLAEGTQENAHAIGSFRTFWVLENGDEDAGIWAVNVTSNVSMQEQRDAGAPMVTGYYARVGVIPPPEVMRTKFDKFSFSKGFRDRYFAIYPDPVKAAEEAKAKEDARIAEALKPIERPAFELTVIDNTIIANRTEEESANDEAHLGASLAGRTAWKRFLGDKPPRQFGLPKPLLAFQADTGKVTPATEEYESVREAAQKGDAGARAALDYLGLSY